MKLLVEKRGNCRALPYLYKMLADELGAQATLSLAPKNVYIKRRGMAPFDDLPMQSFSNGYYDECPLCDSLIAIGQARLNTNTGKIVGFARRDVLRCKPPLARPGCKKTRLPTATFTNPPEKRAKVS